MNSERLLVFVDLTKRKKKLKAELKDLDSQLWKLERSVLNDMEEAGVASTKLAAGQTVYLRTDVIPSRPDNVETSKQVSTLRENGYEFLTTDSYQFQRTQSWVKELKAAWEEKNGEPYMGELRYLLPEEIRDVLYVDEQTRVIVRGA